MPRPPATLGALLAELDAAIEEELAREAARGRTPTCRAGCAYCCHHAIQVSRAEAAHIAAFVASELAPDERARANERVLSWLDWLDVQSRLAGPAERLEPRIEAHAPPCPFLVDRLCRIYPVRPIVCRAHHVSSPPEHCLAPERAGGPPGGVARMMHEVAARAEPYLRAVREAGVAEGSGGPGEPDREVRFLAEAYAEAAGLPRRRG